MIPVHVHLVINHLPVWGGLLAFLLLLYSLVRRKEEVRKVSLALLIAIGLASPAVYFSGEKGEDWAEEAGLAEDRIEAHEDAAKFAFGLLLATGLLAAATLAIQLFPDSAKLKGRFSWATLALALATFAVAARTAWTGGRIHHGAEMGLEAHANHESDHPH